MCVCHKNKPFSADQIEFLTHNKRKRVYKIHSRKLQHGPDNDDDEEARLTCSLPSLDKTTFIVSVIVIVVITCSMMMNNVIIIVTVILCC